MSAEKTSVAAVAAADDNDVVESQERHQTDKEKEITECLTELCNLLKSCQPTSPKTFRRLLFNAFELDSLAINDPIDCEGNTLLHYAIEYKSSQPELCAILFQYGGDMFAKNAAQLDPVQTLNTSTVDTNSKRKLEELFRKYAPGVVRAVQRNSAQCLRRLTNSWCRLDLHVRVAFRGPVSLAEQHLVGKFIELEDESESGTNERKRHESDEENPSHQIERVIDIVRYAELLECGADVLRLLRDAAPSIRLAHNVLVGKADGVRSMLDRPVGSENKPTRIDVDVKNLAHYSATPLFYALRNANDEIVSILLDAGARLDHCLEFADGRELPVVFAALERDVPLRMLIRIGAYINETASLQKVSTKRKGCQPRSNLDCLNVCCSVNDVERGWRQRIDTLHADGDSLLHFAARRANPFDEGKMRTLITYASPRALATRNVRNETIRDVFVADKRMSLVAYIDELLVRRFRVLSNALQMQNRETSSESEAVRTSDSETDVECENFDVAACWTYLTDLVLLGFRIDSSLFDNHADIDGRLLDHFAHLQRSADELFDAVDRNEISLVHQQLGSLFGSPHSLSSVSIASEDKGDNHNESSIYVHVHVHPIKLISSRDGQPLMHKLVLRNEVDLIKKLLAFSSYCNERAIESRCGTPRLQQKEKAAEEKVLLGCQRRESAEDRAMIVKFLLNCMMDNYRRTALFYAVIGGSAFRRMANLLVEYGASEYVTDRRGVAPAHLAAARSGLFVASNRELEERRLAVQKFIDFHTNCAFLQTEEEDVDVRTLF